MCLFEAELATYPIHTLYQLKELEASSANVSESVVSAETSSITSEGGGELFNFPSLNHQTQLPVTQLGRIGPREKQNEMKTGKKSGNINSAKSLGT